MKNLSSLAHLDGDAEGEWHGDEDEDEGEHGEEHGADAGALGVGCKGEQTNNADQNRRGQKERKIEWSEEGWNGGGCLVRLVV